MGRCSRALRLRAALGTIGLLAVATGCGGSEPPVAADGLQVHQLDAVSLSSEVRYFGASAGKLRESADLEVSISSGAQSLVAYAELDGGPQEQALLLFSYVRGPDGRVFLDAAAASGNANSWLNGLGPVRPSEISGTTSLLLPGGIEDTLLPGKYTFRVLSSSKEQKVRFTVVEKPGPLRSDGHLDLNIFLVDGSGYSTANRTAFQPALDTCFRVLAQAGVQPGQVDVIDVSGPEASALASIKSLRDTLGASDLSRGRSSRALNLFVVKELYADGGVTLGGMDPTVPASAGVPDRPAVIWLAAETIKGLIGDGAVEQMGVAIAHEAAHAMGLFHTTEPQNPLAPPAAHDPLSDTPECPDDVYYAKDSSVILTEVCKDHDGHNLMFQPGGKTRGTLLSAAQIAVMRRSPLVH